MGPKFGLLVAIALAAPAFAESKWTRLPSANFEMYTSAGARAARDTVREFEQVRGFFLQAFGAPPARPVPVRLVAFGSSAEYQPYRPTEFATAYYHPGADRDYIVMSRAGADVFPTAVHEYVHLLVRHANAHFPPWLNEGVAELYSTLKPLGNKILVGDLIPGRHQALLQDKWVPLATILAADHDSPYYNEKSKAGNLYNESWALVHMLRFQEQYRGKYADVLNSISGGEDSVAALQRIYEKPLDRIEKDLQSYLRGNHFMGELVDAKLEKSAADIPVEPLADFDVGLMFSDLLFRPGKDNEYRAALEKLSLQDPKRPEPYTGLGYLAWRDGHRDQALERFDKAYERGERNTKLLWDYGRLLESRGNDAIAVLEELLKIDGSRMDVRIELAEAQLRGGQAKPALITLSGTRKVTTADAARYFRVAVYAHLQNGDRENAEATAKHFKELAKSDEDRAAADLLVEMSAPRKPRMVAVAPVEAVSAAEVASSEDRPAIKRRALVEELKEVAAAPARPSANGKFVELDCRTAQPRMVVETAEGRKTFVILEPDKVLIASGSSGPVDMVCGVQKVAAKVEVGYDPAPSNLKGVQGVVRTLAF